MKHVVRSKEEALEEPQPLPIQEEEAKPQQAVASPQPKERLCDLSVLPVGGWHQQNKKKNKKQS